MSDTGYLGYTQAQWDALAASGTHTQAEWDNFSKNSPVDPADPLGWGAIDKALKGGGVTTTPAKEDTAAATKTFNDLARLLEDAGLGSLFSMKDGLPDPNSWLWKQIINNPSDTSFDSIATNLEQTDVYKQRFPVIDNIRKHNKDNPDNQIHVPTATDVQNYESTLRSVFTSAGLPDSMKTTSYMQGLMGAGLSAPEVEQRLGSAYTRVADANPAVLKAYQDFYGIAAAPGALAASFLDPTHVMGQLDKQSMAAYTAGVGKTLGMTVDRSLAEQVAQTGKSEGGVQQDLQAVSRQSGLYSEGISESQDLTTDTGIRATSLGDAQASADLERRLLERQANARTSTGGAVGTNQGLTGLGTS